MQRAEDLTYASYLHLDEILGAQHPVVPDSQGPAVRAAEHFFIVTHQAFELWFKQLLLDLADAASLLPPPTGDIELALDHLHRAKSVLRLLVQQMVLFDHLSPRSFLAFRPYLGAASAWATGAWRQSGVHRVLAGAGCGRAVVRRHISESVGSGCPVSRRRGAGG